MVSFKGPHDSGPERKHNDVHGLSIGNQYCVTPESDTAELILRGSEVAIPCGGRFQRPQRHLFTLGA